MFRWLQHDIVDQGRLPLLCCLVAFILTFFVTRTFVRFIRHRVEHGLPQRWWQPRNVHIGALHIHHVTFGVVLVMISGLTLVTLAVDGQEPEFTIAAIFFGVGAALVLDEYALILHLSDVYWEEDGRSSVDAVFAAVAVAGLLMLGLHPLVFFLPIRHGADWVLLQSTVVAGLVFTLPLAVVVLLKGKVWTGLLGMFIVVLLVVGAVRLSRPHAPWPGGGTPGSRTRCGGRWTGNGAGVDRWCRPSCGCSARSRELPGFPTSVRSTPSWTRRCGPRRHRKTPTAS